MNCQVVSDIIPPTHLIQLDCKREQSDQIICLKSQADQWESQLLLQHFPLVQREIKGEKFIPSNV